MKTKTQSPRRRRTQAWALASLIALALPSTAASDTVSEGMRELHDDLVAAYQKMDGEAIKRLYAKQADDLFFWSRQMTYSWADVEQALDELLDIASDMRFTTSNFRSG